MTTPKPGPSAFSVDDAERVRDFLARHGGTGSNEGSGGELDYGARRWSEVYAADGYTLRCEWSKVGGEIHMKFIEIAPESTR
jgi:hypothetical protein